MRRSCWSCSSPRWPRRRRCASGSCSSASGASRTSGAAAPGRRKVGWSRSMSASSSSPSRRPDWSWRSPSRPPCAARTTSPGASVMDWFAELPSGPLRWTRPARRRFFELLEQGSARSWRLLMITGVLERSLPELGAAAERRGQADLDPLASLHWSTLASVRVRKPGRPCDSWDRVLLAALILDVTGPDAATSPIVVARKTCQRLDVGAATEQAVAGLVADAGLLLGASRRLDGLGEESVLQLAAHLGTPAQADALFLLTEAYVELDAQDRARLADVARPPPGRAGPSRARRPRWRRTRSSNVGSKPSASSATTSTPASGSSTPPATTCSGSRQATSPGRSPPATRFPSRGPCESASRRRGRPVSWSIDVVSRDRRVFLPARRGCSRHTAPTSRMRWRRPGATAARWRRSRSAADRPGRRRAAGGDRGRAQPSRWHRRRCGP